MSLPSPAEIAAALIAREELPAEKGDIGPQGMDGKAGEFGPPGPQGAKGDPGRNGTNGSNGNVGPVGPQGKGGPRGPKGEKGDKGDEGERGPIGPMGPTGAVGSGRALFPRAGGGGSGGGAPSGLAGGDLSGTYPDPSVVNDSHSHTSSTAPGGLPDWWDVDSTPDAESVEFNGRVRIDPTDQSDDPGEGLLLIKTTQDLVDESNIGAIVAALQAGGTNLSADYIFMLTVLGLYINTPTEEGSAHIELRARGVDNWVHLTQAGVELNNADGIVQFIGVDAIRFFRTIAGEPYATQQTAASLGGIYAALEAYGLLDAASAQPTVQTYTESNVTTDRAFNANATSIDELADVLGTLIGDLRAQGVVA